MHNHVQQLDAIRFIVAVRIKPCCVQDAVVHLGQSTIGIGAILLAGLLLIISLSHQGYWFGGQENKIDIQWAQMEKMPSAEFSWRINVGRASLAAGQLKLPADAENGTELKLTLPDVRHVTELQFAWQLKTDETNRLLDSGSRTIQLYPSKTRANESRKLNGSRLVVIESAKSPIISDWLTATGVKHKRVQHLTQLQLIPADIIVVSEGKLGPSPFARGPLINALRQGANVVMLKQDYGSPFEGINQVRSKPPSTYCWNTEHPIFKDTSLAALNSLANPFAVTKMLRIGEGKGDSLAFVDRMPVPRERSQFGVNPPESDRSATDQPPSLVLATTVGQGRLVCCQCPLASPATDPRSRLILVNALTFLAQEEIE